MTQGLTAIITAAGRAALFNAADTGVDADIAFIAFGDGNGSGYEPTDTMTALQNEIVRIPILNGKKLSSSEIVVESLWNTDHEFRVFEIGFVLKDGTFLSIWSDPETALMEKKNGVDLVIGYTLLLETVPTENLTIQVLDPDFEVIKIGSKLVSSVSVITLIRRLVQTENARLIPQIQSTWR